MSNNSEKKPNRGRPSIPEALLKEKIMDAALNSLLEDGYQLTSIDNVAKRAGVAKKTIYRFMENREELVERVVLNWTDSFVPLFEQKATTRDELFNLLQNNLEIVAKTVLSQEAVGLYRLLQTDFAHKELLLEKYQKNGIERSRQLLNQWLTRHAQDEIIQQHDFAIISDLILSMAIAEPLRQISLGLSPAGLTPEFQQRITHVIDFCRSRV
ncbi:TetR family transcriptional regulator [Providencia alcalifaciens]|uniref:TetR family transcriptional regulator n=1 Tax=Providencia alcalifaciens TaxID=126385 RepID=A0A4R3NG56_9GAMM|nr:TetR/AcrR family transcriptional regulator [Providencia alcalifaciens]TCT31493.1 TetR family transcriptional regulator [Providencia alcalifaciens]